VESWQLEGEGRAEEGEGEGGGERGKNHSAEYHTGIKSDRVTARGSSRTLSVLSDPENRICIYTPGMLGSWS
jgi:hypothetical protein